jgi:serine/threonine protein kinase
MINGDAYLPMAIDPDELLVQIKNGTFPNRNSYRPFIPASIRTVINRSLSINPDDRFQTASELRHALEKIKLFTHWLPNTIPNGNEWTCSVSNMEFLAKSLRHSHGCFDFELYKGQKGKPKRIVNADCAYCEKKAQHETRIKNILTRIVTKGK